VLVILGVTGSMSVSSTRSTLERIHGRRLAEHAAMSAFEEACDRLVGILPEVDVMRFGQAPRDLGHELAWPSEVDPAVVRAGLAGEGIDVGPVAVRSAAWQVVVDRAPPAVLAALPARGHLVQEGGVVELAVTARARVGGTRVGRRFRVRR
jgi:hypothetical protein